MEAMLASQEKEFIKTETEISDGYFQFRNAQMRDHMMLSPPPLVKISTINRRGIGYDKSVVQITKFNVPPLLKKLQADKSLPKRSGVPDYTMHKKANGIEQKAVKENAVQLLGRTHNYVENINNVRSSPPPLVKISEMENETVHNGTELELRRTKDTLPQPYEVPPLVKISQAPLKEGKTSILLNEAQQSLPKSLPPLVVKLDEDKLVFFTSGQTIIKNEALDAVQQGVVGNSVQSDVLNSLECDNLNPLAGVLNSVKSEILNLANSDVVSEVNNDLNQVKSEVLNQVKDDALTSVEDSLPKTCYFCELTFNNYHDFEEHIGTHIGPSAQTFVCETCGFVAKDRRALIVHSRAHTNRKSFACSRCDKKFRSKGGLGSHLTTHADGGMYSCLSCMMFFRSKQALRAHRDKHKEYHRCTNCDGRFASESNLVKHLKTCKQFEGLQCPYCERRFIDPYKWSLHAHFHTGDSFSCPFCDHKENTSKKILQHITRAHRSIRCGVNCRHCGRYFSDSKLLEEHEEHHTLALPFECVVCKQTFPNPSRLKIHQLSEHRATVDDILNSNRYSCDLCGKPYGRRDDLIVHRRTHLEEKPFKCRFCGKGCMTYHGVKLHERRHCDRRFDQLRRHIMYRAGQRAYDCGACRKCMSKSHPLTKHMHSCKLLNSGGMF